MADRKCWQRIVSDKIEEIHVFSKNFLRGNWLVGIFFSVTPEAGPWVLKKINNPVIKPINIPQYKVNEIKGGNILDLYCNC